MIIGFTCKYDEGESIGFFYAISLMLVRHCNARYPVCELFISLITTRIIKNHYFLFVSTGKPVYLKTVEIIIASLRGMHFMVTS